MPELTIEYISNYYHLPISEAAEAMNICETVLKRFCRTNNISRWPHRKIRSLDNIIEQLLIKLHDTSNSKESERIKNEIREYERKKQMVLANPNLSFASIVSKSVLQSFSKAKLKNIKNRAYYGERAAKGLGDIPTKTPSLSPSSSPSSSSSSSIKRSVAAWVPPSQRFDFESSQSLSPQQLQLVKVQGYLNKITPQKFSALSKKIIDIANSSSSVMKEVVQLIHDKAISEPNFSALYAKLCSLLNDSYSLDKPGAIKKQILEVCQVTFEWGFEYKENDTTEEYQNKLYKYRMKKLGNMKFIGELHKQQLLTLKIIHYCLRTLLSDITAPLEIDIERICILLTCVGHVIDQLPDQKLFLDSCFNRINLLLLSSSISPRIRFKLEDVIDLRKGGWAPRRAVEEPKKIADIHKEARDMEIQRSNENYNPFTIEDLLSDYALSRDPDDLIAFIRKLTGQMRSSSIVQMIYWSLEKSSDDRLLLSSLFDLLVSRFILNQNNFLDAYKEIFGMWGEIEVDIPYANMYITSFLAHSLKRNLLQPHQLTECLAKISKERSRDSILSNLSLFKS